MATTSIPFPSFGPQGFVAPDEQEILDGVIADMNIAFGGNMNPNLETPQGQLASSETAIIGNVFDLFCDLTQQVDPAYAEGRMQDAIGRIYFLARIPAEATVVTGTCVGAVGTLIPANSIAVATDGNLYYSAADSTIGATGAVEVAFVCGKTGPVICPAGALSTIYRMVPGWDRITNLTDGVVGNEVESRAAFEARRALSVANNSRGSLPSVLGAVLAIPGVLDAYATENTTNTTALVGGVSLVPHSLYVAVVGGNDDAVAKAIWSKKAPGCDYNGNTTVVVEDDNSGYTPPYPAYNVKFNRPTSLSIMFDVKITASSQVPSTVVSDIRNAIIAAFNGEDGGARARIGSRIYASRYLAPVQALGSWVQVISLTIGCANTAGAVFVGSITGSVLTVSSMSAGTIHVGQVLTNAANTVQPGTKILSFVSGSGGTGTYNVSNSQSMGGSTMMGVGVDQNVIGVNIDQVPVIDANNITVSVL